MISPPFARASATLTAATLAAALLTITPAGASTTQASRPDTATWRVAATVGPASYEPQANLSASGPDDAWSTWAACGTCEDTTINVVEHWNGTAWAQVPVPASLAKDAADPVAIASSSASNAWLFNVGHNLRWNGTSWSAHSQPAWVAQSNRSGMPDVTADVFSPTSVWVFSLGISNTTRPDHYVASWNGQAWSKVTMPGVPLYVSTVSADDVWAVGPTPASALKRHSSYVLMHWDGSTWASTALPATGAPAGLAADSATQAWVSWFTQSAGPHKYSLLEWDGTALSQVAIKYSTRYVGSIAQDGQGGLWLEAIAPDNTQYFYHLNGTSWARDSVPVPSGMMPSDLLGLTWVPGTQSLWASMDTSEGNDLYGALLGYGD